MSRSASSYTPLPRSFYAHSGVQVARACLGKLLVHDSPEGLTVGRIVEAEGYEGPDDRAAHSWSGRRTPRTEVMYGPPGYAYLFFVYGMHWQFNLVTYLEGAPHAVLVRAVEPLVGVELMAKRRQMPALSRMLTNGPGKLCQAFGLQKVHYGVDLCQKPLFLADAPAPQRIECSARIGVDYAGEWAQKPWRFFEADNPFVSAAALGRKKQKPAQKSAKARRT